MSSKKLFGDGTVIVRKYSPKQMNLVGSNSLIQVESEDPQMKNYIEYLSKLAEDKPYIILAKLLKSSKKNLETKTDFKVKNQSDTEPQERDSVPDPDLEEDIDGKFSTSTSKQKDVKTDLDDYKIVSVETHIFIIDKISEEWRSFKRKN